MASILPFLRNETVFDPEATQALSAAFDDVCQELKLKDTDTRGREAIAVRIIELARRGERNAKQLAERVTREAGAR
jgi:hypothetical protein